MKLQAIYIYLIYPLWTFLFALQASLFHENLTYVRTLHHELFFLMWVMGTILALAIGFFPCIKASLHQKQLRIAVISMAGLFFVSSILPYDMERMPVISDLHVTLSFRSLCGMLGCIGFLLVSLMMNHTHLQLYWNLVVWICVSALSILFYFMKVNSLVEIFIGISAPILLYTLSNHLSSF